MENTGKKLSQMINGINGISQASNAQTGGQRAMGIASTVQAILALLA